LDETEKEVYEEKEDYSTSLQKNFSLVNSYKRKHTNKPPHRILTKRILKLSAVGNHNRCARLSAVATILLDVSDDVHALGDLAEDDVLAIKPARNGSRHKELRAVRVRAAVGHREEARSRVLCAEVLVGKLLAVDAASAGAVLSGKVTTLAHETRDDAVKRRALVAHAFLAGAECTEVLDGFRYDVVVHLEDNSAGRLATDGHIKEARNRHDVWMVAC